MSDKDPTRRERIKKHLKGNKLVYLAAAGGAIVGAAGLFVAMNHSASGAEIVQKVTQLGFRNEANPTIIQLVEHSTPSKPVHLVGTERYFDSLNDAARKTGHSLSQISRQVKGDIPALPNGDVFERLEPVAA